MVLCTVLVLAVFVLKAWTLLQMIVVFCCCVTVDCDGSVFKKCITTVRVEMETVEMVTTADMPEFVPVALYSDAVN